MRTAFYVPRRGPGKTGVGTAGTFPVVLDAYGTPVRRGPQPTEPNLANVTRAAEKAEQQANRGPTRRERLTALRQVVPGATKGDLRRGDRLRRDARRVAERLRRDEQS